MWEILNLLIVVNVALNLPSEKIVFILVVHVLES